MQQRSINIIVFLSLLGVLFGVTAMSFHHHDNVYLLPACSLCKVKTSFSGTITKSKADLTSVAAALCPCLVVILLCPSGFVRRQKTDFIDSQIIDTYPNKAPPFHFYSI